MIDPYTLVAMAYGGHRILNTGERLTERRERELAILTKNVTDLPTGSEISEVRADGSHWTIRIGSAANA
ncbi:hypothetical protein ACFQVD_30345 [Streptosporangium amethystogenes subsp. fukuiense]|uniref:Uncharacterized protein n=1 Tax=Streptosporangium amethystogenes subsp. fukuiense TaxID=698418 RepID=A0ABW2T6U7_9ACTN